VKTRPTLVKAPTIVRTLARCAPCRWARGRSAAGEPAQPQASARLVANGILPLRRALTGGRNRARGGRASGGVYRGMPQVPTSCGQLPRGAAALGAAEKGAALFPPIHRAVSVPPARVSSREDRLCHTLYGRANQSRSEFSEEETLAREIDTRQAARRGANAEL